MSKNNYLEIIKKQRTEKKTEKFSGTFLEYLSLVEENPDITDHAHKRLYDAITRHGVGTMEDSDPRKHKLFDGDNVKMYDYFSDEFFGMESVIAKIMRWPRVSSTRCC